MKLSCYLLVNNEMNEIFRTADAFNGMKFEISENYTIFPSVGLIVTE